MSENKRSLQSYLKDFEESQEKKTTKSSRGRTDKDKHLAAPATPARKKATKRTRTTRGESFGPPPNVLPPPELGDNLNA